MWSLALTSLAPFPRLQYIEVDIDISANATAAYITGAIAREGF